jgi:hypothetical protein
MHKLHFFGTAANWKSLTYTNCTRSRTSNDEIQSIEMAKVRLVESQCIECNREIFAGPSLRSTKRLFLNLFSGG